MVRVLFGETQMSQFILGEKDQAKGILGVPYGFIFVEGFAPIHVPTMEHGRALLKEAVEKGVIDGDDAAGIDAQMHGANLFETWKDVALHVATFTPPKDFVSSYVFEVCTKNGCTVPIPHGRVKRDIGDGQKKTVCAVTTLTEAFEEVGKMGDAIHAIDAAVVLAQIAATNIPADAETRKQMFADLPEDVRKQTERAAIHELMESLIGSMPRELAEFLGHRSGATPGDDQD
ncbi:MAG: hypothetical protein A3J93_00535 [Candidatus Magasanikbacteria bacterium RIFOXYC2_FULL_42_28]|uniref:Uncharacterized protein n=1 Tax=Candidatus Magasanikbacteria bacterium RIFOXYC2_FULL_42_28 TaxID=1798704 RepID=A0A1F6NWX1_9BACT|nr:MAG: hypothetical protein A3J93_00535 [Candidatus Magasanikbacteria bacterium RIFOXYC2_FULL_42_28]